MSNYHQRGGYYGGGGGRYGRDGGWRGGNSRGGGGFQQQQGGRYGGGGGGGGGWRGSGNTNNFDFRRGGPNWDAALVRRGNFGGGGGGGGPPPQHHHQQQQQKRINPSPFTDHNDTEQIKQEWEQRRERLENLMLEKPSVEDRTKAYEEMPAKEKLVFFYPEGIALESIPPLDPPRDWDERVQNAIIALKGEVQALFSPDNPRKRQREVARAADGPARDEPQPMTDFEKNNPKPDPSNKSAWIEWHRSVDEEREFYRDSSEDEESDEDDDGGMFDDDDNRAETLCAPALHFLKTLQYCPPLTAPFLVLAISYQAQDNRLCYCPCGKHMDRWRGYFGNDLFIDHGHDQQYRCDFKGNVTPFQLYRHILTKKESCKAHWILYAFLKNVFQDYHAKGKQHIALEDIGTKAFKDANRILMKSVKDQLKSLEKEVEEKRELEVKLKKAAEEKEILFKTNVELSNKLSVAQKLKMNLGGTDKEQDLSKSGRDLAKKHYSKFRSFIRETLARGCPRPKHAEITITITQEFSINDEFRLWYSSFLKHASSETSAFSLNPQHKAFLFSPLPDGMGSNVVLEKQLQVVKSWPINFEYVKSENEHARAVDDGGPTKHVFNRLWLKLGDLCVEDVRLFEQTMGGLVPVPDDVIQNGLQKYKEDPLDDDEAKKKKKSARQAAMEKIECYFRAIGRILAHAMLLSENDSGPILIASNVLPNLYKNVLLRDLQVGSEEYLSGDLIEHSMDLLDVDWSNKKAGEELVLKRLGLSGLDEEEQKAQLREHVDFLFVQRRSIALKGLRNGLNLGGIVDWGACFGWMPTKTVNTLAFGRPFISRDMVFDGMGNFRFIKFKQDKYKADSSMVHSETQLLFQQELARLFGEKLEDDPTFIFKFAGLCTGSEFIPDIDMHPEYFIEIEFNCSEMSEEAIPVVHTCEHVLKIPALAYDASMETFESKLGKTMEHSYGRFDME